MSIRGKFLTTELARVLKVVALKSGTEVNMSGRKQPSPGDIDAIDKPAIEIPEKKCCTEDEIGGPRLSS